MAGRIYPAQLPSPASNEYDVETESATTTKYDGRMARPMVAEENYTVVSAKFGYNPHEDTTATGQNRTTET